MKELVSGTKFPTSVGSGITVELVGGLAVELVFDVLVLLLDCASAPITVKDKLANSSNRINPFLEVNKPFLSMLNTHNLYVTY